MRTSSIHRSRGAVRTSSIHRFGGATRTSPIHSPGGAQADSPGQRPGYQPSSYSALKGRDKWRHGWRGSAAFSWPGSLVADSQGVALGCQIPPLRGSHAGVCVA
jgi:hypothetical protein